ncbi:hypothetical protein [Colwellia sp. E2M01]|uniref:hypothetical protein n=1 Tax=Colwellia sp. E2M01 TaxID=2841561 RepID=UPI001C08B3CA|nr:hypothetical protein [Colwellia sp. E2M01]MBU2870736.1 hypothetical protein [Colwellia sp. E2M01]
MKIQYFCPKWGCEDLSYSEFFQRVKADGYDGVEMTIPNNPKLKQEILDGCLSMGLELIAQQVEAGQASNFEEHKDLFYQYLNNAMDVNPRFINCQTGKDYFTMAENIELIDMAEELSAKRGVKIAHELHRGRFSYSPSVTME